MSWVGQIEILSVEETEQNKHYRTKHVSRRIDILRKSNSIIVYYTQLSLAQCGLSNSQICYIRRDS